MTGLMKNLTVPPVVRALMLRLDALTLRERAIIFAAVAAVLWLLVDSLWIGPLGKARVRLEQEIQESQAALDQSVQEMEALATARGADPDGAKKAQLQNLERQMSDLNLELKDIQAGLVPPERMTQLLREVLSSEQGVRLVSIETVPAVPVTRSGSEPSAKAAPTTIAEPVPAAPHASPYWRHGVTVSVAGNYAALTSYLTHLEGLPWRMFWGQARLEAVKYPELKMTLTLYTLSLDKTWLSI